MRKMFSIHIKTALNSATNEIPIGSNQVWKNFYGLKFKKATDVVFDSLDTATLIPAPPSHIMDVEHSTCKRSRAEWQQIFMSRAELASQTITTTGEGTTKLKQFVSKSLTN